ncbi:hypothetical protein F3N42_03295 [Marinihelvus fidelis]|uniref:Methyltransferase domain-containing protein n=1 Tax=Marinihelvus fidelis TaxID=2613842 RepID=A0A5N0TGY5_9GAMM|nr:hypothetical protein [Marinihelvus fidelis]KAA9133387.1 hypothetical protein F3N42_03295 [Marinihelvus fidelis]
MKKIHVGCGPHNLLEGWTNVDIRSFKGVDQVLDVTKEWPFEDVDFVYGEHFIEHLALEDAIAFLRNAGHSLRDGGTIRLTTPNLEWVMLSHYPLAREFASDERVMHVLRTNRAFHGWGHQFLYDHDFLEYLFDQLGYTDIRFEDYGCSRHAELCDIERHGKYSKGSGVPNLLIIEATRSRDIEINPAAMELFQTEFLRHVASGH